MLWQVVNHTGSTLYWAWWVLLSSAEIYTANQDGPNQLGGQHTCKCAHPLPAECVWLGWAPRLKKQSDLLSHSLSPGVLHMIWSCWAPANADPPNFSPDCWGWRAEAATHSHVLDKPNFVKPLMLILHELNVVSFLLPSYWTTIGFFLSFAKYPISYCLICTCLRTLKVTCRPHASYPCIASFIKVLKL